MAKLPAAGAKPPVPVEVANEEPLQVELADKNEKAPAILVTKGEGKTLAPTTTEADDKVTEGQRHVNILWETTQAIIAVSVVAVTLFVLTVLALREGEISSNAVLIVAQLLVLATFIVTSYFTRTNHVRQGGVGPKADEPPYAGR